MVLLKRSSARSAETGMNASLPDLVVLPTADALADEAARRFALLAATAIAARGKFIVALSGGSTPKALFARLAAPPIAAGIDWSRVIVIWGDERCVPPDDAASNYRMAREALLDHVAVPATQVRRIRGEYSPAGAAANYNAMLHDLLDAEDGAPVGQTPAIDLILLGLGEDGHTASLFPGEVTVHNATEWAAAATAPTVPADRVTLTPAIINAAANVLFLVSGSVKAAMLHRVIEGPRTPHELPAQLISPISGHGCWLIDAAAATGLERGATV